MVYLAKEEGEQKLPLIFPSRTFFKLIPSICGLKTVKTRKSCYLYRNLFFSPASQNCLETENCIILLHTIFFLTFWKSVLDLFWRKTEHLEFYTVFPSHNGKPSSDYKMNKLYGLINSCFLVMTLKTYHTIHNIQSMRTTCLN